MVGTCRSHGRHTITPESAAQGQPEQHEISCVESIGHSLALWPGGPRCPSTPVGPGRPYAQAQTHLTSHPPSNRYCSGTHKQPICARVSSWATVARVTLCREDHQSQPPTSTSMSGEAHRQVQEELTGGPGGPVAPSTPLMPGGPCTMHVYICT